MHTRYCFLITVFFTCTSIKTIAQQTVSLNTENLAVYNRNVTTTSSNEKTVVHLDNKANNGIAWINNVSFKQGIIEFDVKGKDVLQQSFVGITFHGINDTTYNAIYFRPFNFNSPDANRKSHSVQYISMPQYDWSYLREKFPGKYENLLTKTIEANSWFHAKVVVSANAIEVFVNGDDKPSLTVKPLNNYTTGKIGFWVGNNSDGDFSNLIIQSK